MCYIYTYLHIHIYLLYFLYKDYSPQAWTSNSTSTWSLPSLARHRMAVSVFWQKRGREVMNHRNDAKNQGEPGENMYKICEMFPDAVFDPKILTTLHWQFTLPWGRGSCSPCEHHTGQLPQRHGGLELDQRYNETGVQWGDALLLQSVWNAPSP